MKKLEDSLHADEPLRAGLLRIADGLIQNAADRIRYPTSDRAGRCALTSRDDKTAACIVTLDPTGDQREGFRPRKHASEKGRVAPFLGARLGRRATNTGDAIGFK